MPIIDLNDRYFLRLSDDDTDSNIDIRIMKDDKMFKIDTSKGEMNIKLSDDEYEEFLNLIKKENNI